MGESVLHAGRPYGGCTILYKPSCTDIYPISLGDSKRTCGIKWKLHNSDGFVNLFTVYMPCYVNTAIHHLDFNNVLQSITMYCLQNTVKYCTIGGDFNADISRVKSMNTASLQNFVSDEGLMFCTKSENRINIVIDYTYYGHNQDFSVIDHFIISRRLSSSIAVYETISPVSNISDHVPLFLYGEWHSPKITKIFDQITYTIMEPISRAVPPRHN